jgi:hypothetical protein
VSAAPWATRRTSEQRPFPQAGPSFQGHPSTYVSRSGVHEHPSFPWFPLIDFPTLAHGLPSQGLSATSRVPQENLRCATPAIPRDSGHGSRVSKVTDQAFAVMNSAAGWANIYSGFIGDAWACGGYVSRKWQSKPKRVPWIMVKP